MRWIISGILPSLGAPQPYDNSTSKATTDNHSDHRLELDLLRTTPSVPAGKGGAPASTEAQILLRRLVLDVLPSAASARSYATALDSLFRFAASRPLTRALLMEYRASIAGLTPSTINVRLSAFRRMV